LCTRLFIQNKPIKGGPHTLLKNKQTFFENWYSIFLLLFPHNQIHLSWQQEQHNKESTSFEWKQLVQTCTVSWWKIREAFEKVKEENKKRCQTFSSFESLINIMPSLIFNNFRKLVLLHNKASTTLKQLFFIKKRVNFVLIH